MSDPFVTVATYASDVEAQLAKNLLENEGIEAIMVGDLINTALAGISAILGDQIVLQVRASNAQRAVAILAVVTSQTTLDEDWEEQAERGAGVWTCSLCGSPVPHSLAVCPSCQTPRDSIRTGRSAGVEDTQLPPGPRRTGEGIQTGGQVRADVPASTLPRQEAEQAGEASTRARPGCLTLLALLALPAWWLWRG
jgi:hypothetical protein